MVSVTSPVGGSSGGGAGFGGGGWLGRRGCGHRFCGFARRRADERTDDASDRFEIHHAVAARLEDDDLGDVAARDVVPVQLEAELVAVGLGGAEKCHPYANSSQL